MKFIFCLLTMSFAFSQISWQPNVVPKSRHHFIVIAHRGDHENYPENTLAAYRQAIKDDADYVEIDLRTTKDGHLISLHNESVDRMTNGSGLVRDLTFAEIKKLQVKANLSDKTHYDIPGFEEILDLCKGKIYIYMDFKDADPIYVNALLKKHGMENQVLVYINKAEQYTAWRMAAPEMPLMLSMPKDVKDTLAMQHFIEQYKPDILDGDFRQYDTQLLLLAQKKHLNVWPDGQSQSEGTEVWDEALRKGLTGLQTDHPQELVNYLKKINMR